MHQLFATLLSLLLALCHHLGHAAAPVRAAVIPAAFTLSSSDLTAPAVILPDRYQFARYASTGR